MSDAFAVSRGVEKVIDSTPLLFCRVAHLGTAR